MCEMLSRMKLVRPIRLASLISTWNDVVVRDRLSRTNISHYALSKMNKIFKARII